jgi:hypothetical protein
MKTLSSAREGWESSALYEGKIFPICGCERKKERRWECYLKSLLIAKVI